MFLQVYTMLKMFFWPKCRFAQKSSLIQVKPLVGKWRYFFFVSWGKFFLFFKKVASNFFLFFKHPSRALSNLGASWSFLRLVEALEVISEVFLFLKFGWKWRFSVILSLKWFEKVKFHQNKFFLRRKSE